MSEKNVKNKYENARKNLRKKEVEFEKELEQKLRDVQKRTIAKLAKSIS